MLLYPHFITCIASVLLSASHRLSYKEECNLCRKVQKEELVLDSVRAREQLILANKGLVRSVVNKYLTEESVPGSHQLREDLIQEGTFGFLQAVERFNTTRGTRLSTYAFPWIRARIMDHLHDHIHTVRLPRNLLTTYYKSVNTENALRARGVKPTMASIAEEIGVDPKRLAKVRRTWASTRVYPLLDYDTMTLSDLSEDLNRIRELEQELMIFLRRELTPFELKVVVLKWGFSDSQPKTLKAISRELHCSEYHIRKICEKTKTLVCASDIGQQLRAIDPSCV